MTNSEIRGWYREQAEGIRRHNEVWITEGLPPRERALRAWKLRREARAQARSRMQDVREVEALRLRDGSKYGDPDGPSFEQALASAVAKGFQGDAAFEEVIRAAARTDPVTAQALFGAAPYERRCP